MDADDVDVDRRVRRPFTLARARWDGTFRVSMGIPIDSATTGQTWQQWCEEQKGLRETFPAPSRARARYYRRAYNTSVFPCTLARAGEMKATAKRLREQDAKKWTQKRIAQTLGVTRQCVDHWFNRDNATNAPRSNSCTQPATAPVSDPPSDCGRAAGEAREPVWREQQSEERQRCCKHVCNAWNNKRRVPHAPHREMLDPVQFIEQGSPSPRARGRDC